MRLCVCGVLLVPLMLASCQTTGLGRSSGLAGFPVLSIAPVRAPSGEADSADGRETPPPGVQPPRVEAFRQDGRSLTSGQQDRHTGRRSASRTSGGIELAFEEVPVEELISVVLGDMLGAGFVIDPAVEGRITLRSAGPVLEADIPYVLEQALQLNAIALTQSPDGLYAVTPAGRGRTGLASPRLSSQALPLGEGVVIVPLRFISAPAMVQLLEPYRRSGAQTIADSGRSLLILTGETAQITAMLDMVEIFDVDWLTEMSVALYPLQVARPDALVSELYAVLGGREGPAGHQLEFVALNRLNAIIALTPNPARLDDIEAWIRRLDVRPAQGRDVRVRRLTNADAGPVAEHLMDLFSSRDETAPPGRGITIRADEGTNSVLIAADAASQDEIEAVIQQIDRAPDQVLVEALIVEVVLNDDLQYGVQWYFDTRDGGQLTSSTNQNGGVASSFPGFSYTYDSNFVRAALNAISSLTQVETLSSPQIVVRNNSSATVQVGDQVPVVTQSAVSVADPDAPIVNSIQFRDTGVVLEVAARIGADGLIVLDVVQEVSSVAATTTSGIDSPTIQQRRLESSVSLYDGEAVVLGGLIRSQQTTGRSGVPGLQRVPGLGTLFSDRTHAARRTELLVFLTPHIMRTRDDSRAVTQALRERMTYLRAYGFADAPSE